MAFKYIIGDTETDKATEATLPDGGLYNHTVALGDAGNATWLHIIPGDPSSYVDFYGTYNSTSNPTHNDNVFHLGHNVNPGGGPVISGRGVLSDAWESYYNGGHIQQERHLKWVDADGYETRFISFEGHLDVGSTNLFIDSTTIRLGSGRNANTPPSVSVAPTITAINSPDGYNVALFDQDAGGYVRISAGSPSAGQDRAAVQVSASGQASITTHSVGTLMDANAAQPQYYWDANNTILQSPDATSAKIVMAGGSGPILYANNVAALLVQFNQVFINNRLLYIQRDAIANSARGDIYGSFLARNTTAATGGAPQQFSPPIVQTGYGWTGSANRAVSFQTQVQPDGTGDGKLIWGYTNDEANYAEVAALTTIGDFLPGVSGTPSLGSASKKWKDGYFSGTLTLDGYAKLAATVGTWINGPNLNGVDSTNSNFIKYTPNDAGTTSWYQWASSFANGPDRRNQVMRFGWNVAAGGGRVTSGADNGALASEYEQFFIAGTNQMERHETYVSPVDVQTRYISFAGSLESPYLTRLWLTSGEIYIGTGTNPSDNQYAFTSTTSATTLRSVDQFKYITLNDTFAQIQAGTTGSATAYLNLDEGGDAVLKGVRGFMGTAGANFFKWNATSADMFSPDGTTDLYVDNGGFQFLAANNLMIRSNGDYLNLNAFNSGITIQKAGSRAFRTAGVGESAGTLFGTTDVAYLSLINGSLVGITDNLERIQVADGSGIIFKTNNTERARFDYSSFRPSTNGTFKNGDNGARWSEVWTVDLYANGTSTTRNIIPEVTDGYSLGTSANKWKDGYISNTHSSWFDTKLGTQLTAAATITPTSGLHHVTGATTIDTIAVTNVPSSSTVELVLIADAGVITLSNVGNIKIGTTIAQDTAQKLVWDGSFWYLVA